MDRDVFAFSPLARIGVGVRSLSSITEGARIGGLRRTFGTLLLSRARARHPKDLLTNSIGDVRSAAFRLLRTVDTDLSGTLIPNRRHGDAR